MANFTKTFALISKTFLWDFNCCKICVAYHFFCEITTILIIFVAYTLIDFFIPVVSYTSFSMKNNDGFGEKAFELYFKWLVGDKDKS